jgi:hypothetical protein
MIIGQMANIKGIDFYFLQRRNANVCQDMSRLFHNDKEFK